MKKGYMFYDDETANSDQRICSIAYILQDYDGNQVGQPVSQLIDPESEFDYWNTRIHGIGPDDIAGKPNFYDFCVQNNLAELLTDYIFVAHNAQGADLHHLKKSLAAYGIEMPVVSYIDTMGLSVNDSGIGKLADASRHYGVDLKRHHAALDDALACMGIFSAITGKNGWPDPFDWIASDKSGEHSSHGKRAYIAGHLGFVNASDETIEEVLERFDSENLRGNPDTIDSLEGIHLVVTGRVPNYENDKIEEALKAIGAKPAKSVSGKTQLLVIGDNAGQGKINPAEEKGIPVITVPELLGIIDR